MDMQGLAQGVTTQGLSKIVTCVAQTWMHPWAARRWATAGPTPASNSSDRGVHLLNQGRPQLAWTTPCEHRSTLERVGYRLALRSVAYPSSQQSKVGVAATIAIATRNSQAPRVRGCGPPPTHSTRPMAARSSDRARQGIAAALTALPSRARSSPKARARPLTGVTWPDAP